MGKPKVVVTVKSAEGRPPGTTMPGASKGSNGIADAVAARSSKKHTKNTR